jgi:hypothetical protein
MVGFDIPFAFVASGLLTSRARGQRPDLAMLYCGAGVAVPGLAFLEKYPDWDWQYFVDPNSLPIGSSALFLTAIMCAGWAGTKVRAHSLKWVWAVAGLLGLFCLFTLPRTLHVGTIAQYQAGEAPFISLDWLIFGLPWFAISGAVGGFAIWGGERARRAKKP